MPKVIMAADTLQPHRDDGARGARGTDADPPDRRHAPAGDQPPRRAHPAIQVQTVRGRLAMWSTHRPPPGQHKACRHSPWDARLGLQTRRLVDVAQELIVRGEDCAQNRGIWIEDVARDRDGAPTSRPARRPSLVRTWTLRTHQLTAGTLTGPDDWSRHVTTPASPACGAGGAHMRRPSRAWRLRATTDRWRPAARSSAGDGVRRHRAAVHRRVPAPSSPCGTFTPRVSSGHGGHRRRPSRSSKLIRGPFTTRAKAPGRTSGVVRLNEARVAVAPFRDRRRRRHRGQNVVAGPQRGGVTARRSRQATPSRGPPRLPRRFGIQGRAETQRCTCRPASSGSTGTRHVSIPTRTSS